MGIARFWKKPEPRAPQPTSEQIAVMRRVAEMMAKRLTILRSDWKVVAPFVSAIADGANPPSLETLTYIADLAIYAREKEAETAALVSVTDGWQPIESAPAETAVVVCGFLNGAEFIAAEAYKAAAGAWFTAWDSETGLEFEPVYWLSSPPRPKP